jgi:hypothetical protein
MPITSTPATLIFPLCLFPLTELTAAEQQAIVHLKKWDGGGGGGGGNSSDIAGSPSLMEKIQNHDARK